MKLIQKAAYSNSTWNIWDDFIYMSAAALAQPFTFLQEREDEYLHRINSYDKSTQSLFPEMFAEITRAFQREGLYDILGEIYMEMNLSNHWKGQFFTPFNVCHMMAKMSAGNVEQEIEKKGFLTVGDPCCGGGAMLIAFAKSCQEQGVNYQNGVLFVGQDIDPVVARMCFLQMSLLGMSGCVKIGDSLTQQISDVWYTPMYFMNGFQYRKQREITEPAEDLKNFETEAKKDEPISESKVVKPFDIDLFHENVNGQIEMVF